MNKAVLMIMAGAVLVAIIVAMVMQASLSPKGGEETVAKSEILVAAKKLSVGQKLKAEDVRWQSWPENAMYKGVYKKADFKDTKELPVYDTPLRRALESGEPVTDQALIPDVKGANNFLAASIAPGKRAMAVSVKPSTSVGGFLSPGDHVDVILSYTPRFDGDMEDVAEGIVQRYASQTIIKNVKVLAVDQDSKDEERAAKVAKTVTLELSREQAEVLSLASSMGDINLALRRMGDKDPPNEKDPPLTTDMKTSDVMKKVAASTAESKTNSGNVRLYSGTNIQNIPVRKIEGER